MKRTIYFVVAVLASLFVSANAQGGNAVVPDGYKYVPIVREGVEWGYEWTYPTYGKGGKYSLIIKGDTVVDGKTYKKIYRNPYLVLYESRDLAGLVREETGGKVYGIAIRMMDGSVAKKATEKLLYDFGAKVGERFSDMPDVIVEKVEYVALRNGDVRKMFHAGGLFVEGIGRIDLQEGDLLQVSFYNSGCFGCIGSHLTYVAKSGLKFPTEEDYEFRDDLDDFAGMETIAVDAPSLSIRQSGDDLVVATGCDCYDRAELADMKGRLVQSVGIANGSKEVIVPISGLQGGVYILSLKGSGSAVSEKVIVR